MRKNRNTNTASAERAWVRLTIGKIWFDNNDQYKQNNPAKTIKTLQEITARGEKEGYEDMIVLPTYTESDPDTLEQYYIEVIGWRLETDAEYKRRLESILAACKRERDNFDLRKKYYETDAHSKRVTELENAIDAIRMSARKDDGKK